jgi:hypothetical protein
LDSEGHPTWARSLHEGETDFGSGLAVSPSGDLLVATTSWLDTRTLRLSKFDELGQLLWQFVASTNASAEAHAVQAGFDGETYVAGSSDGHAAIWKIQEEGELDWLKVVDGSREHSFVDLAIDQGGSLMALGYFTGDEVLLDGFILSAPDRPPGSNALFFTRLKASPPEIRLDRSGADLVLSWPTNQPSFQLEATGLPSLMPPWQPVEFASRDARFVSTNSPVGQGRIFRLRKVE